MGNNKSKLDSVKTGSAEEAAAAMKDLWSKCDTNGNKQLDKDEALKFFELVFDYLSAGGLKFPLSKEKTTKELLEIFDTDKNGILVWEEFLQTALLVKDPHQVLAILENKAGRRTPEAVVILESIELSNLHLPNNKGDLHLSFSFLDIEEETQVFLGYSKPTVCWLSGLQLGVPLSAQKAPLKFTAYNCEQVIGTFEVDLVAAVKQLESQADYNGAKGKITATSQYTSSDIQFLVKLKLDDTNVEQENAKLGEKGMDKVTLTALQLMRKADIAYIPANQISLPKNHGFLFPTVRLPGDLNFVELPSTDDTWPISKLQFLYLQYVLSGLMKDDFASWPSHEVAKNSVKAVVGKILPVPCEGPWDDLVSDKALTRYFFQGIGATLLKANATGFEVDMNFMKAYETRPGFYPYQGRILFDKSRNVVQIEFEGKVVKPGEPDWDFGKYLVRSTALMLVTMRDHLIECHYTWSNSFNISAMRVLPSDHPLRRLIHPHTFRASYVNYGSMPALLYNKGLLHRTSGLEFHSFARALTDLTKGYLTYHTFKQTLADNGLDKLPLGVYPVADDGLELHKIMINWVTNYIHIYYNCEEKLASDGKVKEFWTELGKHLPGLPALSLNSLIEAVTEFIFRVSFFHNHVGNVVNYVADPYCAGTRIAKGLASNQIQSTWYALLIVIKTGYRMPKITEDYGVLLLDDAARRAFAGFQSELAAFEGKVKSRNESRPCFNSALPSDLELSVAV